MNIIDRWLKINGDYRVAQKVKKELKEENLTPSEWLIQRVLPCKLSREDAEVIIGFTRDCISLGQLRLTNDTGLLLGTSLEVLQELNEKYH